MTVVPHPAARPTNGAAVQFGAMAPALPTRQEEAALLVAEDELTDSEIAARVGIKKRQLENWKKAPAFAAAVAWHREQFRQKVMTEGFADKVERVRALNAVALDLLGQVRDSNYQTVIGLTQEGEPVEAFDRQRLREFREYLKAIAEEVGDRGSGKPGGAVNVNVGVGVAVSLPPEERVERLAGLLARVHAGRD